VESVEILALQIEKTVEKLKRLNDENCRLKLEVEYLRKESERTKRQVGEYVLLKKNTELAACKIERIIKKIDTVKV
jgi:regulator of replication initiation timing